MTNTDIRIDPRGYRFGAGVSLVGAVVAVLMGGVGGAIALAILAALFLPGATIGPQATLQAFLFRTLIRPRIGAPMVTESFRPPRFAQQIGLVLSATGAVCGFVGWDWGVYVFGGFVLAASFLNSVFGFCLGCEIYLGLKRLTTRSA
jgi:hypothetical protein